MNNGCPRASVGRRTLDHPELPTTWITLSSFHRAATTSWVTIAPSPATPGIGDQSPSRRSWARWSSEFGLPIDSTSSDCPNAHAAGDRARRIRVQSLADGSWHWCIAQDHNPTRELLETYQIQL